MKPDQYIYLFLLYFILHMHQIRVFIHTEDLFSRLSRELCIYKVNFSIVLVDIDIYFIYLHFRTHLYVTNKVK